MERGEARGGEGRGKERQKATRVVVACKRNVVCVSVCRRLWCVCAQALVTSAE